MKLLFSLPLFLESCFSIRLLPDSTASPDNTIIFFKFYNNWVNCKTCYDIWFRDGGKVETKIFIWRDQEGQN